MLRAEKSPLAHNSPKKVLIISPNSVGSEVGREFISARKALRVLRVEGRWGLMDLMKLILEGADGGGRDGGGNVLWVGREARIRVRVFGIEGFKVRLC